MTTMNDKPPRQASWQVIAGVAGLIAILSGLEAALWLLPDVLDGSLFAMGFETIAIYVFSLLVVPLAIGAFVGALKKKTGLVFFASVAILGSLVILRLVSGLAFGFERWMIPLLYFLEEDAFVDALTSVISIYYSFDLILALVLLVLAISQRRDRFIAETGIMTFGQAIKSYFRNYVGFSGRATRAEYWWIVLFGSLLAVPATLIDLFLFGDLVLEVGVGAFTGLLTLALLLPSLALIARRFHDVGLSGWLILVGLVPLLGSLFIVVISLIDSQRGSNRFGASAKYPARVAA